MSEQQGQAQPEKQAVYGLPISDQRRAQLQGYLDRWEQGTEHGERRGPFDKQIIKAGELFGVNLSGADVSWLAEQSGRDEYGRVPNLHLEGANLYKADLKRAELSRAHLEGATLVNAHMESAQLGRYTWKMPTSAESTWSTLISNRPIWSVQTSPGLTWRTLASQTLILSTQPWMTPTWSTQSLQGRIWSMRASKGRIWSTRAYQGHIWMRIPPSLMSS
jgi:Pentapeptide repeats (8 copies)